MSISGHKSVSSLKLHERTTMKEKECISEHFSNALLNKNETDKKNTSGSNDGPSCSKDGMDNLDVFTDGMDDYLNAALKDFEDKNLERSRVSGHATFAPVFYNCSNVNITFHSA